MRSLNQSQSIHQGRDGGRARHDLCLEGVGGYGSWVQVDRDESWIGECFTRLYCAYLGNSYGEKAVKRLGKVIDSWAVFWLTLICVGFYLAVQLWPASYWLEVRSVNAGPAQPWSVVPMAVSRTVKRDFRGEWTVGVKRFGVAGWVSFCSASLATIYNEGAELPADLDLDWWTNGACPVLPEGRYFIDTSWRIRPGIPFLPNKDVTIRSNIFEVKP